MRRIRPTAVLLALAFFLATFAPPADRVVSASPGPALRIVDDAGNTPVVNEGGRVALRVVDGSGNAVSASSWSTDNKSVGRVKRSNGLLRGKTFGFATVTAQTSQGPVSGFVVCARLRQQNGAMTQGDTKTDTGGNVYLSSPTRHVLYKATAVSADVFAGATGESGYQEGTGDGVRFNGPAGIGVDNRAEGGLYVADTANHCIRKIDFRGRSSLAAGTPGFDGTMHGDENPISEAVFTDPRGVASVGANLFVTDTGNHCVWYVDVQRQRVQLVAGEPGNAGNTNGEGRAARFNSPSGITVNTRGNLLAVADTGNNVVRLIAIAPRGDGGGVIGQVTTLGLGSSARNADVLHMLEKDRGTDQITFDAPISVSFDGVDNVYVIDNQTASVVTRPPATSGRPVERVDLAQVGTLGNPASVTVRRTKVFVLDEAATSDASAVNVVEVGAPTIASITPDAAPLAGNIVATIRGTNFAPEAKLTLGDAEVTNYMVESSTRITFTVPAQQAPGARTLTVITRGGVAQSPLYVVAPTLESLADGEITTIVGGVPYLGDGGDALNAIVAGTSSIAVDGAGSVYCADTAAQRVRKIDSLTGIITTVAGTGVRGFAGDGDLATSARLDMPKGVAIGPDGSLYISDSMNHRVRRVDPLTGLISTVVGSDAAQTTGDGGPPHLAGLIIPSDIAVTPRGELLIADEYGANIRRADFGLDTIVTIAGVGIQGYSGDNGPALSAALRYPRGLAVGENGDAYVSDSGNHVIRKISASTGLISTIAGTGVAGFNGDNAIATSASLNDPRQLVLDSDGSLFIADFYNQRVRRIDLQSGRLTTYAGTQFQGNGGDGGPATEAILSLPTGVVLDAERNLLIAAGHLRRVSASSGVITTISGLGDAQLSFEPIDGTRAALRTPTGLALDSEGDLYIADQENSRIRVLNAHSRVLSTFAGGGSSYLDDQSRATDTILGLVSGLCVDQSDNVFIADGARVLRAESRTTVTRAVAGGYPARTGGDGGPATDANVIAINVITDARGNLFIAESFRNKIRRVDAATGIITTFAGTGEIGSNGDGGPATSAQLSGPYGLAVDAAGNVYVGEFFGRRVRRINVSTGMISTVAGGGASNNDDVPATSANLANPQGLAYDGNGNLLIASTDGRVRRVDASTQRITTIAGTGQIGYAGDGGNALGSKLFNPYGLAVDRDGNVFISDGRASCVRVIRRGAAPSH